MEPTLVFKYQWIKYQIYLFLIEFFFVDWKLKAPTRDTASLC